MSGPWFIPILLWIREKVWLLALSLDDWSISPLHKAWDKWLIKRVVARPSSINLNLPKLLNKFNYVEFWFLIYELPAIKLRKDAGTSTHLAVLIIVERDSSRCVKWFSVKLRRDYMSTKHWDEEIEKRDQQNDEAKNTAGSTCLDGVLLSALKVESGFVGEWGGK